MLFVIGGALLHVINLATGGDYTEFADPAHFQWVTDAWRAVVAPNQLLFIGLLIVFEATVGLLVISGGRRTQAGYIGIIAFYLALWLFGPDRDRLRARDAGPDGPAPASGAARGDDSHLDRRRRDHAVRAHRLIRDRGPARHR